MKAKNRPIKKPTIVYLDAEGVAKYQLELDRLKEKYNEILLRKCEGSSFKGVYDTEIDPSHLNKLMDAEIIYNKIVEIQVLLDNAIIIDRLNDDSVVDINDTIVIHDNTFDEDSTIKLVASFPDFNTEIQEVSINSPMGKAIFNKHVGETVSFNVQGKTIEIVIVEKVNKTLSK